MFKKYMIYLIRWQLSTPILAVCVAWLAAYGATIATIVANFIGGLLFFWVDRWIFKSKNKIPRKDMDMIFEYMRTVVNNAPEIRLECLNKKEKQSRLERTYDTYGNMGIEFEEMMDKWSESTRRRWYNHIMKELEEYKKNLKNIKK